MNAPLSGALIVVAGIYLAPTILAVLRGHLSRFAIFLLNILLGWTLLGWIVALVWAATSNTKANREVSVFAGQPMPDAKAQYLRGQNRFIMILFGLLVLAGVVFHYLAPSSP
jgi:hypothetical protein